MKHSGADSSRHILCHLPEVAQTGITCSQWNDEVQVSKTSKTGDMESLVPEEERTSAVSKNSNDPWLQFLFLNTFFFGLSDAK